MEKKYNRVRGMHDITPAESYTWHAAEKKLAEIAAIYGYREIRTPLIEEQRLFERSIGSESDIVSKEIYTFNDRKGRQLALRPEGTASVVRAYINAGMHAPGKKTRLYYYGPMFRYDRPQRGRYRQFYQFGIELMGGSHPFFDGEAIQMLNHAFNSLNVKNHYLAINTLGCAECKTGYTSVTKKFFSGHKEKLCHDCIARADNAPLRILDCKKAECRQAAEKAPGINEILCIKCREHFKGVEEYLAKAEVPYKVRDNLVRGLDYYTRTVFELYVPGDENAVAAGGRYDSLVKELGGPDTPAVGFAIGMERLIALTAGTSRVKRASLYLACIGEEAVRRGIKTATELRSAGICTETSYEEKSLRAHMKTADKSQAGWCAIIGDQELQSKKIKLKNMSTGEQKDIPEDFFIDGVKETINAEKP